MSVRGRVIGAVTVGAVGLAAAGAGIGVNRQRRRIAERAPDEDPGFGSLRSEPITVVADDGTPLHVEVDEPDQPIKGRQRRQRPPLTVVFAHGYALELDCWHFQREHFRGQVRTVFYDQRSHGRSGRSPVGNATIDQLGADLLSVLDAVAPEGPVVLVGHSMGGMTIVALAEQHPELFGDRVVGTALISTTAGGLEPSRILFPMVPAWGSAGPVGRAISTLARTHKIVDGVRRAGKDVALVATAQLAFGDDVPGSYVEFVDRMLSATPFEVVAEFFPGFSSLDKFDAVEVLAKVPTAVVCGTDDKLTSIGHSRKLHSRIDGSTLLECHGAGHMVLLERHSEVNGELDQLLAATGAEDAPVTVEITRVGPESAAEVLAVVRSAFAARPPLDPPAAALDETEQSIADKLSVHGGLLACLDGRPVGALVLDPVGSTTYLRRFGVAPDAQGHGVAAALIDAAVDAADGSDDLTVVAREELPQTVRFWERQGFREIRRDSPNVELRRPLRTHVFQAPDADAMRGLGRSLAGQLTRGDLIVLSGELGAGKTTFTQGLGAGLGVRGDITSPTFVIARVHPSLVGGPELVHVDAYRLGGLEELDDLDLDTSLDDAVTVVEWGEGLAEGLSESRLEVAIVRGDTAPDRGADDELDPRRVELTPVGPRWHALSFRALG